MAESLPVMVRRYEKLRRRLKELTDQAEAVDAELTELERHLPDEYVCPTTWEADDHDRLMSGGLLTRLAHNGRRPPQL